MDVNNQPSGKPNNSQTTPVPQNSTKPQSGEGASAAAKTATDKAAQRLIDQLNQPFRDKVSISHKAEKLQNISTEFFSGTINSGQIPALTQRLYENGLINQQEFKALGGNATAKVSAISESVHFLNNFILDEAVDGDTEGANALRSVVQVIEQMNNKSTAESRQQEKAAIDFINNYTDLLKETGASADTIEGFTKVGKVLSALDKVRSNESSSGALATYASVQEAHNEMYNSKKA